MIKKINSKNIFLFLSLIAIVLASTIFSYQPVVPTDKEKFAQEVVKVANDFYNQQIQTFSIHGQTIRIHADCSNFVRAVYWQASKSTIDLFQESRNTKSVEGSANGVTLIGKYFQKNHRFGKEKVKVGDVIIFDNTYDKNKNNKRDDWFTHVGIIIDIHENGTIEFVHGNFGADLVKKGYVNLQTDAHSLDSKEANTYLRRKKENEKHLPSSAFRAAALLNGFGGY